MKVLVTGKTSYAGLQFAKRVDELNLDWEINYISVRDNEWRDIDFSIYDAIYHVAGIVHKQESHVDKELYYKVNRDLTYQLALKAKKEGVKSFVFLSSMAVYGLIGKIGKDEVITKETKVAPNSHYGKSKYEAEQLLIKLQSTEYKVCVLRIPMIYGPNCPGNYASLSNLVKNIPFFPKIDNRRSMVFIDYLSEAVINIIRKEISGLQIIKNPIDVSTFFMVNEIAKVHGIKVHGSIFLGFLIKLFGNRLKIFRKIFGNLYFKNEVSDLNEAEYSIESFIQSIVLSEKESHKKEQKSE